LLIELVQNGKLVIHLTRDFRDWLIKRRPEIIR